MLSKNVTDNFFFFWAELEKCSPSPVTFCDFSVTNVLQIVISVTKIHTNKISIIIVKKKNNIYVQIFGTGAAYVN